MADEALKRIASIITEKDKGQPITLLISGSLLFGELVPPFVFEDENHRSFEALLDGDETLNVGSDGFVYVRMKEKEGGLNSIDFPGDGLTLRIPLEKIDGFSLLSASLQNE